MPPLTLTLRPSMSALPPPANGGVYTLDELLAPHADLLASLALPYAELEYHSVPYGAGNALEPDGMAAHTSKLGGVPFTPAGHPWPRTGRDGDGTPYHFVAQVNFAEAPPLPGFPSAGILQVFSDFTGQDWDDSNGLVRYLGPALAQAPQVLSPPMDEEHREEYEETDPVSSPARISYRAGVSAGGASDAGFLAALKAVGLDTEEWWGDERSKGPGASYTTATSRVGRASAAMPTSSGTTRVATGVTRTSTSSRSTPAATSTSGTPATCTCSSPPRRWRLVIGGRRTTTGRITKACSRLWKCI